LLILHSGFESHLHRGANSFFVQAIGQPTDNFHLLDQTVAAYQNAGAHQSLDFVLARRWQTGMKSFASSLVDDWGFYPDCRAADLLRPTLRAQL